MSDDRSTDYGFMLGKIDGKIDGITQRLNSDRQRVDQHESRIQQIETVIHQRAGHSSSIATLGTRLDTVEDWKSDVTSQGTGALKISKIFWAIGAGLIGIMSGQLIDFEKIAPHNYNHQSPITSNIP